MGYYINSLERELMHYGLTRPLSKSLSDRLSISENNPGVATLIFDGVSDNTVALQTAINYAATEGTRLELPYGIFNYTDLYLYYDPILNPGYPQGITNQGRICISGQGRMFIADTYYGTNTGTILKCTSSTGGIHSDVPTGGNLYQSSGFSFRELSILGNTSGTLVDLKNVNNTEFKNVLIVNTSLTGNGCYLGSAYILVFDGFEVVGGTAGYARVPNLFSTGVGLEINGNGGFISGNHTTSGFNIGTKFSGNHTQIRMGHFEPHHCNIGLVMDGTGITNGVGFDVIWVEGCTYAGIKCINGATLPSIGTSRIEQPAGDWTASREITKVGYTLIANGNIYYYLTAGTTHSSTAPSGTGTNITDGTATCKYVGTYSGEYRACINVQDACTPSEAFRTMLGDLYLTVDCGTSAIRVTASANSQEIEINSLTVAGSGLAFSGHGVRSGIVLSDTGQPGILDIKAAQFVGFDSTDVKCTQFSALAGFHEIKKGRSKHFYNTGTSATLSMVNGEIIRVLDSTTPITALEGQYSGSMVTLYMNVAGVKLVNSASLVLEHGIDYTFAQGDSITFVNSSTSNTLFGTTWTEVSRSIKGGYSTLQISTVTTTTFTIIDSSSTLIINYSGTCTLTLPTASNHKGRLLHIRTITANSVISNASNVSIDGVVGTSILSASIGKWAKLQSDGSNWVVIENN